MEIAGLTCFGCTWGRCAEACIMKLIVKAGSAGKEALTTATGEVVDVEFARKHMELVEANEEYSNQVYHVRVRSKTYK